MRPLIQDILEDHLGIYKKYFEPFKGSSEVHCRTRSKRFASDIVVDVAMFRDNNPKISIIQIVQDLFGTYPSRIDFSLADPKCKADFQEQLRTTFLVLERELDKEPSG